MENIADDHGHDHVHDADGRCCSHDHSDEREVYLLPTASKLAACRQFKLQANLFFKECQWKRARSRFEKCLVYLDYTFPDSEEEKAECDEVRKAALLGIAVCSLKSADFRIVVQKSSQVLRDDPASSKALYLRSKAYLLLSEFANARDDINKCLSLLDAENKREAVRLLAMINGHERMHRHQMKGFAEDMFAASNTKCEAAVQYQ